MIKKLWDNEIGGRIYLQSCHLFAQSLFPEAEKDRFFKHSFAAMHKLTAIKYHLENYRRIEREQFLKAQKAFKRDSNHTTEAFELIFEFEAFLFQVKSSLDMLVKLMIPILGRNEVHTETYGKKGDTLVKGLDQFKKRKEANVAAIDDLIRLVKQDKDDWIEKVIDMRDDLNHREGLVHYHFAPAQLPNGDIVPIKPRFRGMDTLPFMEQVAANNIEFHQDFLALALAIRARGMVLMREDPARAMKAHGGAESTKYVKWAWGMPQPPTPAGGGQAE